MTCNERKHREEMGRDWQLLKKTEYSADAFLPVQDQGHGGQHTEGDCKLISIGEMTVTVIVKKHVYLVLTFLIT